MLRRKSTSQQEEGRARLGKGKEKAVVQENSGDEPPTTYIHADNSIETPGEVPTNTSAPSSPTEDGERPERPLQPPFHRLDTIMSMTEPKETSYTGDSQASQKPLQFTTDDLPWSNAPQDDHAFEDTLSTDADAGRPTEPSPSESSTQSKTLGEKSFATLVRHFFFHLRCQLTAV